MEFFVWLQLQGVGSFGHRPALPGFHVANFQKRKRETGIFGALWLMGRQNAANVKPGHEEIFFLVGKPQEGFAGGCFAIYQLSQAHLGQGVVVLIFSGFDAGKHHWVGQRILESFDPINPLREQLLFKLAALVELVKKHFLGQLARIWQAHDVGMRLQPEHVAVAPVILKGSLPNSDELPFAKPFKLLVEDLSVPDLVGFVDDSDFRGVIVKLEHLQDLHLEVEIEMLIIFLDGAQVSQGGDELLGQHAVVLERGCDEFSEFFQTQPFRSLKR